MGSEEIGLAARTICSVPVHTGIVVSPTIPRTLPFIGGSPIVVTITFEEVNRQLKSLLEEGQISSTWDYEKPGTWKLSASVASVFVDYPHGLDNCLRLNFEIERGSFTAYTAGEKTITYKGQKYTVEQAVISDLSGLIFSVVTPLKSVSGSGDITVQTLYMDLDSARKTTVVTSNSKVWTEAYDTHKELLSLAMTMYVDELDNGKEIFSVSKFTMPQGVSVGGSGRLQPAGVKHSVSELAHCQYKEYDPRRNALSTVNWLISTAAMPFLEASDLGFLLSPEESQIAISGYALCRAVVLPAISEMLFRELVRFHKLEAMADKLLHLMDDRFEEEREASWGEFMKHYAAREAAGWGLFAGDNMRPYQLSSRAGHTKSVEVYPTADGIQADFVQTVVQERDAIPGLPFGGTKTDATIRWSAFFAFTDRGDHVIGVAVTRSKPQVATRTSHSGLGYVTGLFSDTVGPAIDELIRGMKNIIDGLQAISSDGIGQFRAGGGADLRVGAGEWKDKKFVWPLAPAD